MAFLVSINFSTPLCTINDKSLVQRKFSGRFCCRRVREFTNTTVTDVVAPKFLDRIIWSLNRRYKAHVMKASRNLCEKTGSSNLNVSDIAPRVILGFWVGPDIEDGWGFIEALVNQIF